jgi:hypothetical protein
MVPPCAIVAVLALLAGPGVAQAAEASAPVEFNRDVRPILSENCFYCHGQDPNHRKADLRLDVRESALKEQAIVPGKPEASKLVARILADGKKRMPPPDSHRNLSAEQKELLRR